MDVDDFTMKSDSFERLLHSCLPAECQLPMTGAGEIHPTNYVTAISQEGTGCSGIRPIQPYELVDPRPNWSADHVVCGADDCVDEFVESWSLELQTTSGEYAHHQLPNSAYIKDSHTFIGLALKYL
jgi:hypothetical protein